MSETTNTPADVASLPAKLLPCPFCGDEAALTFVGNVHSTRKVVVKCGGCRYQRTDAALRHGDEWLRNTAIAAWNRRASPAGEGGLPELLDEDAAVIRGLESIANDPERGLWSQSLSRGALRIIRRLATPEQPGSAVQGEAVECVICGGDGCDPEFSIEPRCCGRADPNGDCCGNPEPEQILRPCRQCGGSGKVIPVAQVFTTPPPAPAAEQGEFPECSGDPASCPENEGHGCCKRNDGSQWQPEAHGAMGAILAEVARATRKFPTWPTDPLHAVAVVNEEVGELNKALLQAVYEPHKSTHEDVATEAIQAAAMAYRFVASLDRYNYAKCEQHEQPPLAAAPAAPGAAVDDAMVERAWRAGRAEYSKRVKLSREWDEPDADDIASMRAALTAALAGKDGAKPVRDQDGNAICTCTYDALCPIHEAGRDG